MTAGGCHNEGITFCHFDNSQTIFRHASVKPFFHSSISRSRFSQSHTILSPHPILILYVTHLKFMEQESVSSTMNFFSLLILLYVSYLSPLATSSSTSIIIILHQLSLYHGKNQKLLQDILSEPLRQFFF